MIKNPPASAGDPPDAGWIPWWGRSLPGGNVNLLQCSCLENPMHRGAWRAMSTYKETHTDTHTHTHTDTHTPWGHKESDMYEHVQRDTHRHTQTHTHTHTHTPWGHKESDMYEHVQRDTHTHTHTHTPIMKHVSECCSMYTHTHTHTHTQSWSMLLC